VDDQRGCWLVSVLSLAAISDGIKLLTQRFLSEQIEGQRLPKRLFKSSTILGVRLCADIKADVSAHDAFAMVDRTP